MVLQSKIDVVCGENGKAYLNTLYSEYPIRVINQIIVKTCVYLVAVGFGGGFVQGDQIISEMAIGKDCQVCFKTQGSTKVYKTGKDRESSKTCIQKSRCTLAEDSFLLYIPDPVTCFEDSKLNQVFEINIHKTASLVFVDWFTSGRLVRS